MERELFKNYFKKINSLFIMLLMSIVLLILFASSSYRILYKEKLTINFDKYPASNNINITKSNCVKNIITDTINDSKKYIFFKEEVNNESNILKKIDSNINTIKKELNYNGDNSVLRSILFNEINDISIKLNSFLNENTEIYINFLILFSTGSAFITLIVIFSILLLILMLINKDFSWMKNVSNVFMVITMSYLLASFILTIIFSYSTRLPIFDIRIEFLRVISNVTFNNQVKIWILLLTSGLIYRILYIIFNKTIKNS